MKIKCAFCKRKISNPTMRRVTCGRKECRKEYSKDYKRVWNRIPEKREKVRKYVKEYNQRPDVMKRQKIRVRTYSQALRKLRRNHPKEFEEIYKELKGGEINGKEEI